MKPRSLHRLLRTGIAAALLISLTACGSSTVPIRPSEFSPLRNKGIQVLSNTNPYHGPNMVLARAIERSPNLSGFVHHNGPPTAIEVRGKSLVSEEILLYYPQDYQVVVARRSADHRFGQRDWLVHGPYAIGKRDFRFLRSFYERREGDPYLRVHGNHMQFASFNQGQAQRSMIVEPNVPLIPKPRPKPKKVVKKKPKVDEAAKEAEMKGANGRVYARMPKLDDPNFVPKNSDQRALMLSKGYAKRAPNGDILHEVQGGAQSLNNLADWYMGSSKMLAELQEANNFAESQTTAKKGVVVRIPVEFIKNTKQMPINHRIPQAGVPGTPAKVSTAPNAKKADETKDVEKKADETASDTSA